MEESEREEIFIEEEPKGISGFELEIDEDEIHDPEDEKEKKAEVQPNTKENLNNKRRMSVFYEGESWTVIPDKLLCCGKLITSSQLRLWLILRKYSEGAADYTGRKPCYTRQDLLAYKMGVSERRFRTVLKEMEDKELIRVSRPGLGRTNLVFMKNPIEWLEEQQEKEPLQA